MQIFVRLHDTTVSVAAEATETVESLCSRICELTGYPVPLISYGSSSLSMSQVLGDCGISNVSHVFTDIIIPYCSSQRLQRITSCLVVRRRERRKHILSQRRPNINTEKWNWPYWSFIRLTEMTRFNVFASSAPTRNVAKQLSWLLTITAITAASALPPISRRMRIN